MSSALIVFVRRPERGKVKTRLAATLGADGALAVYKHLLQHTLQITAALQVAKYVFYTDAVADKDEWQTAGFVPMLQSNTDLGGRMHDAFETVFAKQHQQVVIIGSDCIELSTTVIQAAFDAMKNSDVIIGPANDGGYYLLGMKQLIPSLFTNIAWSTESVYTQTLQTIQQLNLSVHNLPQLIDIDTEEDLDAARSKGLFIPAFANNTQSF